MSGPYWRAGEHFPSGHRVLPGSWGRGLAEHGQNHPRWPVEDLLEQYRPAGMPKRTEVAFAFADWQSAWSLPWDRPYIHRVDLVGEPAPVRDMSWTDVISTALRDDDGATAESAAAAYWRGLPTRHPRWEILSVEPLTVVRLVYEHRVEQGDRYEPPPPEPA